MSEQTINERHVKLSSKVPFPMDLSLGEDFDVLIKAQHYVFNVVKQEINDRQDGSVDVTYVAKCAIE